MIWFVPRFIVQFLAFKSPVSFLHQIKKQKTCNCKISDFSLFVLNPASNQLIKVTGKYAKYNSCRAFPGLCRTCTCHCLRTRLTDAHRIEEEGGFSSLDLLNHHTLQFTCGFKQHHLFSLKPSVVQCHRKDSYIRGE